MRKQSLLFLLALACIVLGCNRQNNPQPAKPSPLPANIADYDLVMLDNGDLNFYNSKTATMTLLEAEEDSVVNVAFTTNVLYYSVAKDGRILLRCIDLDQPNPQPKQLADWGVPYEECLTETYGTVSPLEYHRGRNTLGLHHNFSWDGYWFIDEKLYNIETGEITDWTWEWEEAGLELPGEDEENYHYISTSDEMRDYLLMLDGKYYMTDGNDDNYVCLTDQMDFSKYISEPDFATDIEFDYIAASPDNQKVLYMVILEWGDFPHGILAISSVDGKFQMPLEDTDCTGFYADWLDDNSLVYVGIENDTQCIKRIYPDGHVEVIAHCGEFYKKQPVVH